VAAPFHISITHTLTSYTISSANRGSVGLVYLQIRNPYSAWLTHQYARRRYSSQLAHFANL